MKTVDNSILDDSLMSIANIIRYKTSQSLTMSFPNGFIDNINKVTNYIAESKSVYPSISTIRIFPSSGYDAISAIYVDGSGDLLEENIRYGATIFGVIGDSDGGLREIRNKTVKKIASPVSVISPYTFYHCESLNYASFSNCIEIGSNAFDHCHSLSSIYFPNCEAIREDAFANCSCLYTISFSKCTKVDKHAFWWCENLKSVSLEECLTIGSVAFGYCDNLSYASFPKCSNIDYEAFHLCVKLSYLYAPSCKKVGGNAFWSCYALSYINIERCQEVSKYAFWTCNSLKNIALPSCIFISSSAFAKCTSLSSIYLLGSSIVSLLNTNAFNSTPIASGTGNIYVPASLYSEYISSTNWSYYSSRIVSYVEPSL